MNYAQANENVKAMETVASTYAPVKIIQVGTATHCSCCFGAKLGLSDVVSLRRAFGSVVVSKMGGRHGFVASANARAAADAEGRVRGAVTAAVELLKRVRVLDAGTLRSAMESAASPSMRFDDVLRLIAGFRKESAGIVSAEWDGHRGMLVLTCKIGGRSRRGMPMMMDGCFGKVDGDSVRFEWRLDDYEQAYCQAAASAARFVEWCGLPSEKKQRSE